MYVENDMDLLYSSMSTPVRQSASPLYDSCCLRVGSSSGRQRNLRNGYGVGGPARRCHMDRAADLEVDAPPRFANIRIVSTSVSGCAQT